MSDLLISIWERCTAPDVGQCCYSIIPALIAGAAAVGSTFLQHVLNKKDWSAQNRYNSPREQVSRLKDAGLSPALMYQNAPSNTADSITSTDIGANMSNAFSAAANTLTMSNLKAQNRLINSQTKGQDLVNDKQKIENDVLKARSKEEIASADAFFEFMNETFYTEEEFNKEREKQLQAFIYDWQEENPDKELYLDENDDKGNVTPYFIDSEGRKNWVINAVNMFGYTRRYRQYNREFSGQEINYANQKINNKFQELQQKIYEKYGDKIEKSKLESALAIIRNATITGNINKLDYDTFSKLGIGPNVIRAFLGVSNALSGEMSSLMGAASMFMK